MVCGTTSDAGKTTVVTGLCRLLARRGLRVAPFKAQNMALNSYVTAAGHEIGRAQAAQAMAAGVEPEVAMNPILLKPTSDRRSQVVVHGRPWAILDAAEYHRAKPDLADVVFEALADLRDRFDVVICEGAGSPAEINLLDRDIVNLSVAAGAGLEAVVVGDIDRGGVFAALYGTVGLLPDHLRRLVRGFVINKFRGDPGLLGDATAQLEQRSGIPTLGVLPWVEGIGLDAEDSMGLVASLSVGGGTEALDVAVIRLPRISNFTDLDPLVVEPDVAVRFVGHRSAVGRPDLLVLPGTKATVGDLAWLRASGLADAVVELAASSPSTTILGICGGYQMLGRSIHDTIEWDGEARDGLDGHRGPEVPGLGLLDTRTVFEAEKFTARRQGRAFGRPLVGYQIHHGRSSPVDPWIELAVRDGAGGGTAELVEAEGSSAAGGRILGSSVHGLLENDGVRVELLRAVAARAGRRWEAGDVPFSQRREERFDRLADLLEHNLDVGALDRLLGIAPPRRQAEGGRPSGGIGARG
jgi:adenosylcobyric acid synthase